MWTNAASLCTLCLFCALGHPTILTSPTRKWLSMWLGKELLKSIIVEPSHTEPIFGLPTSKTWSALLRFEYYVKCLTSDQGC